MLSRSFGSLVLASGRTPPCSQLPFGPLGSKAEGLPPGNPCPTPPRGGSDAAKRCCTGPAEGQQEEPCRSSTFSQPFLRPGWLTGGLRGVVTPGIWVPPSSPVPGWRNDLAYADYPGWCAGCTPRNRPVMRRQTRPVSQIPVLTGRKWFMPKLASRRAKAVPRDADVAA